MPISSNASSNKVSRISVFTGWDMSLKIGEGVSSPDYFYLSRFALFWKPLLCHFLNCHMPIEIMADLIVE